ncbi:MAG: phosphatidylinositol mannoside acyltransferase [Bifidobacterium psychraerophilum]|uniref:phosphatidylinositol mannoside acyltransferase n=1 Tax=Bifidobacterium psychraerophilum TaxID=218140 RepID=UPI0039EC1D65
MNHVLSALAKHASWLPETLIRAVFSFAADAAWLLHIAGVRRLERNLRQVLQHRDGQVDRRTLRRSSRKAMHSYFMYFAEALTVGARSEQELLARIRGEGEGFASIQELCVESSAPIAMGHQGNWDYAGFWANTAIAPVTTVAERLKNEELLKVFVSIREELGMTILLTGEHGLIGQLEERLDEAHVIVPLLADRDLSRHGVFVNAFGSMMRVARGPATIALETGRPLYVFNMHREALDAAGRRVAGIKHGYVCTISGPIDPHPYEDMPKEEAITALSQAWVDIWSAKIEDHPEDWHMLQPVFIEDLDLARMHGVPENIDSISRTSAGPSGRM